MIACGGTGGHLTPGIALAQQLRKEGHQVGLVTSSKQVDLRLRKKYKDLEFYSMTGCGFSWNPIRFVKFCGKIFQSYINSLKLLRRKKVDGVIAFGGFNSLGICLAAKTLGKPIFLHEANQQMGKAIRMLSPLAKKVFIPAALKQSRYPKSEKFIAMGYPLREEFQALDSAMAKQQLGIPENDRLIVITGGSQGAKVLVEWVEQNSEYFRKNGWSFWCLTGLNGRNEELIQESSNSPSGKVHLYYEPFSDRMNVLFSAADLVISRAGAGSIAEMVFCNAPMVLVPYPFAAHDHQNLNAEMMARYGAAKKISQGNISQLMNLCEEILWRREDQSMRRACKLLQKENASSAEKMVQILLNSLKK